MAKGLRQGMAGCADADESAPVQIMGSEVGVVDIPNWDIASKGRLMPGNIFLVDFDAGRVIKDDEASEPHALPVSLTLLLARPLATQHQ